MAVVLVPLWGSGSKRIESELIEDRAENWFVIVLPQLLQISWCRGGHLLVCCWSPACGRPRIRITPGVQWCVQ